jgi:hypothetical protein
MICQTEPILLFMIFFEKRNIRNSLFLMVNGVMCLVWPISHYIFGTISDKTGGTFWIKSEGIQSTLSIFSGALFPQINGALSKLFHIRNQFIVSIFFIIVVVIVLFISFNPHRQKKEQARFPISTLIILFIVYLIIVVIIDTITPISTTRNFITILPLISIIVSVAAKNLVYERPYLGITLILLLGLSNIYLAINIRPMNLIPAQNHKDASAFIAERISENPRYRLYYLERENSSLKEIQFRMANFYLKKQYNNRFNEDIYMNPIHIQDIPSLSEPSIIFIQHSSESVNTILNSTDVWVKNYNYYEPVQRGANSATVLYSEN